MEHADVADRVRSAYETAPAILMSTDRLVRLGRRRRRARAAVGGALGAAASVLVAVLATVAPWQTSERAQVAEPVPATQWNPAYLAGLWRVTDAEGQDPDTWLDLTSALVLMQDCGTLTGSYEASGTHLLTYVSGFAGDCGVTVPKWLSATVRYTAIPGGWQLLDGDGNPVAALVRDRLPDAGVPGRGTVTEFPPVLPVQDRADTRPVTPLPAGLRVATSEDVIGTWVPADPTIPRGPSVTFTQGGAITSSDGCNGTGGRWTIDDRGHLLTAHGYTTLIGCEGAPVQSWINTTAHLTIDGDELVLLTANGQEIERLRGG